LLAEGGAPRPQGWLVRKLRLEELFIAIERRAASEGEIPLGRFRTFLVSEEIQESSAGVLRVRAQQFAVVHWQAPQTNAEDYLAYLRERWGGPPDGVTLAEQAWFRDGGAYALFHAPAVYERALSLA
jgi:hypothetical protein